MLKGGLIIQNNALDVAKEALGLLRKDEEKRPLVFRQYDNMLARGKILQMLKGDGVLNDA
jgi:hypothetical protein